jgi:hypothetical protein
VVVALGEATGAVERVVVMAAAARAAARAAAARGAMVRVAVARVAGRAVEATAVVARAVGRVAEARVVAVTVVAVAMGVTVEARAAAAIGGAAIGAVAMGAATVAAERVARVAFSLTSRWSLISRPATPTAGVYGTGCSGGLSVRPPRGHQTKQPSSTSAARELGWRFCVAALAGLLPCHGRVWTALSRRCTRAFSCCWTRESEAAARAHRQARSAERRSLQVCRAE